MEWEPFYRNNKRIGTMASDEHRGVTLMLQSLL
jgi:hypothetical protein